MPPLISAESVTKLSVFNVPSKYPSLNLAEEEPKSIWLLVIGSNLAIFSLSLSDPST